jgi:uncharacterized membrane protein
MVSHSGNKTAKERLLPLDALRGLIIIFMAIDHASFFIAKVHPFECWGVASLPVYTDALSFLTRFITHPCAPGFFFLMGTSMILFANSRRNLGWSDMKIRRYFALRGFILIVLQFFLENFAWLLGLLSADPETLQMSSNIPGGGGSVFIYCGVLYALGSVMIVCSLLLHLKTAINIIIGGVAILASQILIPGSEDVEVLYSPIVRLILIPGQTGILQVLYPVIPWLGIAILGLIFGRQLIKNRDKAYSSTLVVGLIFIFLFIAIRMLGGFGNFHVPKQYDFISFLNVTKYPPSLAFILITLGIVLLLLYLFTRVADRLEKFAYPLLIFGRTALFFYITHLYLYAFMGFLFPKGISIPFMYIFWFIGVLLLYPLCKLYGNFKKQTAPNSVWRFF